MKRLSIVLFAVLAVALMLPLAFGPVELPPEQGGVAAADNLPGHEVTLDPKGCTYCSADRCGCAAPSAGCTLTASCSCGSRCEVSCVFNCE